MDEKTFLSLCFPIGLTGLWPFTMQPSGAILQQEPVGTRLAASQETSPADLGILCLPIFLPQRAGEFHPHFCNLQH